MNGWRCPAHTLAALAGRPEPYAPAAACFVSPVEQPASRAPAYRLELLPELNAESLEQAALRYAQAGIPVLPLKSGTKLPATKHGVHDASTNLQAIRSWWRDHRYSNIGLATGLVFDVVDIDTKNGAPGMESLDKLRRAGLLRGVWGKARTPSGGLHLLVVPSGDGNHSAGKFGVDYRGRDGYIVAAPSVTETGKYRWDSVEPDRRGLSFGWQAAKRVLGIDVKHVWPVTTTGTGSIDGLIKTVTDARPGERNNRLHWAACRAAEEAIDLEILREPARAVGLSDAEINSTLASAARQVRP
jgi:Bifunctional DNA primase/polymerase, N-terminal